MGSALTWFVGVARALTGVVLLAAPGESADRWVGGRGPRESYLVRGIGGRDLVIGGGIVHALTTGRDARPWLAASVLGDVTDAVAAVGLDDEHGGKAATIAGGFGVLGALAYLALTD